MNNEINAFGEGVTEGGLRNTTQIKILVEYVIESLKDSITSEMMVEAIITNNLANYFEVSQAISDLIENGCISVNDEMLLCLTDKGSESLKELVGVLPATVKERAISAAAAIQLKYRNEGSNKAVIVKSGEGYNVICNVLHNDAPVMSLTLYTTDFTQAENIKIKFMEDPAKIYATVISAIYG